MEPSTWVVAPNIAVIKYWGKRDSRLNLPYNGSVSLTMDETLSTKTSVKFDQTYKFDRLILNGNDASEKETARASRVLDAIRKKAGIGHKALVVSENNFPTAAGIASSSSGFAAIALAASEAAGLNLGIKEISAIARLGSGSACRSVIGGFVEWKMGKKKDGSDSYAVQIAPPSHWPSIRNVIAITDEKRKKTGSNEGMELTVKTSILYPERVRTRPRMISLMKKAILERNLQAFLELTMKESSNLHAVMLDSYPPIIYLNDTSREIMEAVHEYNRKKGTVCAGYTFDAGPNAHVFTDEKYAAEVKQMLEGIKGVQRTIVCKVGEGPRRLSAIESLI
ncbi:MAG: diphosphomevalonate decarboxylase [Candidatus Micrarchaeota archaeon]|nr:diphosphomevalonate decarboxylase [Candidatus Micrarchaeota archaeon]